MGNEGPFFKEDLAFIEITIMVLKELPRFPSTAVDFHVIQLKGSCAEFWSHIQVERRYLPEYREPNEFLFVCLDP